MQPGVAHGIQLTGDLCKEPTCGGLAGRLLVAYICHAAKGQQQLQQQPQPGSSGDVACPGCYSFLLHIDDHGASWHFGAVAAGAASEGTREASLVQLAAGAAGYAGPLPSVYASERNLGASPGTRRHSISTDGGSSFSLEGSDSALPDGVTKNWTGIVAGAMRFGPAGPIVVSTPLNRTARQDMALFSSSDEAASWSSGKLFYRGPSGYSDCQAINASAAGILFENGDSDAMGDFANRISFATFTVADL